MRLSLDFVIESIEGTLLSGSGEGWIKGVNTDSRRIKAGELFFALQGDNFDGHDYIHKAWQAGAAAAVISKPEKVPAVPAGTTILVRDTLQALQTLAGKYRRLFAVPVVAITGSVGKTTTKDILAECLAPVYNTLKTPGNFNNAIGLPLTLLSLEQEHQAAVVELGMSSPGEIAELAEIARPDYAVITNIEPVHLETMGSLENIARAKCEVLNFVNPDNFVLINGDSALLQQTAAAFAIPRYTFGFNENCDIRVLNIKPVSDGINVTIDLLGDVNVFYLPVPARQLALNLAAAVAAAYFMGVSLEKIKTGLLNYRPSGNRLNIMAMPAGGLVINDTYNANPVSMIAALEVCRDLGAGKRTVAVLGDMLELGDYEIEGHMQVGKKTAELNLDILITIGERAAYIGQSAILNGMPSDRIKHFNNRESSLSWLKDQVGPQDVVLFKGSRGMELDILVNAWLD